MSLDEPKLERERPKCPYCDVTMWPLYTAPEGEFARWECPECDYLCEQHFD